MIFFHVINSKFFCLRAIIQRVLNASVTIDGKKEDSIGKGLLVLLGITDNDSVEDVCYLAQKIANMRIFSDQDDKMNLSVLDTDGEIMVVSQFTLFAQTRKGNRPSFIAAARPEMAIPLYENFLSELETFLNKRIARGVFGADMKVALVNDGPVTIFMDSKNKE